MFTAEYPSYGCGLRALNKYQKLPEVPADYLQINTYTWCHTDRIPHALEKLPIDYGEENSFIILSRPP
jgi:hypothetical protein